MELVVTDWGWGSHTFFPEDFLHLLNKMLGQLQMNNESEGAIWSLPIPLFYDSKFSKFLLQRNMHYNAAVMYLLYFTFSNHTACFTFM